RHRALMSGLAALLVTLTAALGVGLALVNAEREKTRRALADKEGEAVKARQAADRAEKAEKERRVALRREGRSGGGGTHRRRTREEATGTRPRKGRAFLSWRVAPRRCCLTSPQKRSARLRSL